MHSASIAIKAIIENTPGYSLQTLLSDLDQDDDLLTVNEACKQFKICKATVFNWIKRKKITPVYLHGSRRLLRLRASDIHKGMKAVPGKT